MWSHGPGVDTKPTVSHVRCSATCHLLLTTSAGQEAQHRLKHGHLLIEFRNVSSGAMASDFLWHPISRRSGAPRERAFPALCHRPTGARCGVCRVLTLSLVHVKGSCRRSLHAGRGTVPCTGIGCQRRGLRRRHGLPSQARNERKFDSPRGCRKSLGGSPRGSRYKNLGPPGPGEGIARPP